MALARHNRDGGTAAEPLAPPSLLHVYVFTVCFLGALGVILVIWATSWASTLSDAALGPLIVVVIAALIGEMKPLTVPRGDEPAETVSTSTPFILALIALGGVGIAVLAQAVASIGDDLLNRRQARKSAFNTAQYTLSVMAGRGAFCVLAGEPFFGDPVSVGTEHLVPLLFAGVVMVFVNRLLVAIVISIAASQQLRSVLQDNVYLILPTHFVLICIGAVAALVAEDGVGVLALLGGPVVAVYLTTSSAVRHAHQASHDSLTSLGNRNLLYRRLSRVFSTGHRGGGPGLVLLDLDHFKDINDTLGHPVGDQLLKRVSERLVAALDDGTLAHRLGGDEFAVVVDGNLARTHAVAQDLLATLEAPIEIQGLELLIRASAGVAVGPDHGTDAETLMKNADIALYHAKLERDRISTYSAQFDVNTVERLQLLADLRAAIDTGQLGVAFQPQVDLAGGRTVGVEALIRWEHPTRGAVPPDDFIPLAENSGLIAELTAYVLDTALAALARWRADGHDVRMAVNLSPRHLSDLALPRQVLEALDRHAVPSETLVLEVTETGILADPARVDVVIAALRGLGVGIAVDDYGTGHASLSYLKRLEIDELKVDRTFVSDMAWDHHDFIIVRSTIALARDLGLRVIAEGIEDESTAATLRSLGCDIGQGYHLGRPTTAEAIRTRLDDEQRAVTDVPRQR